MPENYFTLMYFDHSSVDKQNIFLLSFGPVSHLHWETIGKPILFTDMKMCFSYHRLISLHTWSKYDYFIFYSF